MVTAFFPMLGESKIKAHGFKVRGELKATLIELPKEPAHMGTITMLKTQGDGQD